MTAAVATTAQVNRPSSRQKPYRLLDAMPVSPRWVPNKAVSSSAARSSEWVEELLLWAANKGSLGAITGIPYASAREYMVKGGKPTWETKASGRCVLLTAVSKTFLNWVEVGATQRPCDGSSNLGKLAPRSTTRSHRPREARAVSI